ncbi:hypothetical protein K439DRAFT_1664856, partial [Ramaria rubella]
MLPAHPLHAPEITTGPCASLALCRTRPRPSERSSDQQRLLHPLRLSQHPPLPFPPPRRTMRIPARLLHTTLQPRPTPEYELKYRRHSAGYGQGPLELPPISLGTSLSSAVAKPGLSPVASNRNSGAHAGQASPVDGNHALLHAPPSEH